MAAGYPPRDPAPAAPPGASGEPSLAELAGGLIADARALLRNEILLAKTEIKQEISKAVRGALSLAIGGALAALGGFLFLIMLVHLIATLAGTPLWVSYLIVGGVLTIIGAVLALIGKSRLEHVDPVPREMVESVREDVEWLKARNPSAQI